MALAFDTDASVGYFSANSSVCLAVYVSFRIKCRLVLHSAAQYMENVLL